MDKNNKSKLLGVISFISMLLLIFFAVKYLSVKAETIDTNVGMVVEEKPALADQFIVPKLNTLYVYYSYSGDQTIEDAKLYKNEIVIENRDGYVQKKSVMADFTEYDDLILDDNGKAVFLGSSSVNTRESLIDNIRFAPYNNIFYTTEQSIILSEPIGLHNTWQYSSKAVSEITSLNTLVELPFGNFTAIEVVTNFEDGQFRKDYYVKFLGLVKSVISDVVNGDMTIYLHDVKDDDILSKAYLFSHEAFSNTVNIELIDNYISTSPVYIVILENMLKYEKNSVSNSLIQKKTHIQSVEIDRRDNIVYVDFSDSLFNDTTTSEQANKEAIKNIANIIGNYYQVAKVKITSGNSGIPDANVDLSKPFNVDLQER